VLLSISDLGLEELKMTFSRYENLEFLELPDCDGLLESGQCGCLDVSFCRGNGCSFYHKKNSLEKVFARLRELVEEKQAHISQKYYNGERPWAERDDDL